VEDVLAFVEKALNDRENSMFASRITSVIGMQQQVVAGMNYRVSITL